MKPNAEWWQPNAKRRWWSAKRSTILGLSRYFTQTVTLCANCRYLTNCLWWHLVPLSLWQKAVETGIRLICVVMAPSGILTIIGPPSPGPLWSEWRAIPNMGSFRHLGFISWAFDIQNICRFFLGNLLFRNATCRVCINIGDASVDAKMILVGGPNIVKSWALLKGVLKVRCLKFMRLSLNFPDLRKETNKKDIN